MQLATLRFVCKPGVSSIGRDFLCSRAVGNRVDKRFGFVLFSGLGFTKSGN